MRLRARLTLTIAAASVVPILIATLLGREIVQRRSRAEFDRLLRDGEVEVLSCYRLLREEVCRSVERLADPEDQFIGPILIALAQGGVDNETFRKLAVAAPRAMQGRGLDVLSVLGPRGEILASGHFPGRMGDIDPQHRQRAGPYTRRGALLLPERVFTGGHLDTPLTVQAWRTARSPLGSQVVVVGGRRLGAAFVRSLRLRGGTEVRIQTAAGAQVAGPADWGPYAAYPRQVIRLGDPAGKETARVTLAVPDDSLRTTLRLINFIAVALLGSGLALALLLGILTARRITRPVQEVVDGFARVAAGDLELRLPVRSRDEMGRMVDSFNREVAELKDNRERLVAAERLAAWREIARRIAHEIKNPLFPIQTSIETLRKVHEKKHPDFEEIFEESTTTILEEVHRLKNIVTEFSRFARMTKPQLVPCSLAELIPSVVTLYSDEALPLTCELPEDLPEVLADREQITQVLVNLIQNAKEAQARVAEPRTVISASADREGEWVEVRVQDNGPGFEPEEAGRIFTPYYTTKAGSGGSGLGLAIAQRIMTDHGGRIEAKSEAGRGATFTLRLAVAGR